MTDRIDWQPRWNDAHGDGEAVIMSAEDFRRVQRALNALRHIGGCESTGNPEADANGVDEMAGMARSALRGTFDVS